MKPVIDHPDDEAFVACNGASFVTLKKERNAEGHVKLRLDEERHRTLTADAVGALVRALLVRLTPEKMTLEKRVELRRSLTAHEKKLRPVKPVEKVDAAPVAKPKPVAVAKPVKRARRTKTQSPMPAPSWLHREENLDDPDDT